MTDAADASAGAARRPRRICFVVPTHWAALMGGSQYQVKVLIEHLLEAYDVEIYFLTVKSDPQFRPQGYEIVQFSTMTGIRRYGHFLDAFRLYRALERIRPDIVYQQVGCGHTGIAAFYARRAGARMIWRVSHDRTVSPPRLTWWRIHHRIEQKFLEYGIRHADLILAQTEIQKTRLAEHYGRDNVVVVPNFHPQPRRRAADVPRRTRKRVAWVANLKPFKNPHAFARLALKLRSRQDVELVMVGAAMMPGRWTDELLQLIETAPNLRYMGRLPQEQVNELLEESDLLVNTSDHEGFSNVFIQAWMRRVPVVTLHVDPDGLLSERQLGCVSHDEDRLAEDVERLLDDDALREEIGERCRVYAAENHSTANIERLARLLGLERRRAVPAAGGTPEPRVIDGQAPNEAFEVLELRPREVGS
ncbi:MAG: glycosyltransferase family 4 protein [Gammaproteobacteria bacterium]|nr:glycosyltransferase family 4 protein [Gammaproteobacteria bacterium]